MELKLDTIKICEECRAVFRDQKELEGQGGWGHVCKQKKYKEEHRCESYCDVYTLPTPRSSPSR